MIKVIASDMDGTLLGDDHRIAPETLASVRRACDEIGRASCRERV